MGEKFESKEGKGKEERGCRKYDSPSLPALSET
jgi:hypothetical protein